MKSEYLDNKRFRVPRNKRNILKLTFSMIILILVIETGRIFLGIRVAKPIVAQWGVIEKGCWVETLFLRDESLLISEAEGSINQKVENGARVSRGTVVAFLNTGFGLAAEPDAKMLQMERRLFTLLSEDEALDFELERVNKEINLRKDSLKKSPAKALEIKEDLGSLEQEKQQILRNIKSVREKILKTRVAIKEGMRGFRSVIAPEAGYIYFQYDNWEGRLTPDHFFELSEEEFRDNFPLKQAGNRFKNGAILGKIINPYRQIVAVKADTGITGTPETGDSWWFKTDNGLQRVTISKLIPLADRKVILAFEDPGISQQYMPNRRSKIFAIYKRANGVIIPQQALIKKEHKNFVKIPKGDDYRLQEVQVLETDEDKAVIEGIDFGTTIISR